jgi:parallel beta-helix repeat protein
MAWDGTNLWITDRLTDSVYQVTTTGTVLSSFAAPSSDPKGLTWDGTNLWITDNVTNLIYEITTTGTVLDSFPAVGGEPQGLTWDGVNLWVVQANLDTIYEMTTAGAVVSSFPLSSNSPEVGHTWDGTNLWQATGSGVEEWTTTGTLLSSFADPCTNTRGITFDGTDFWIACDGGGASNFIYQVEGPSAQATISGTISEDRNGDSNLADAVGVDSVTAVLYKDGGDGQPDGVDDTPVDTTVTDINGDYSFTDTLSGDYWVVVDSRTISPSRSFTGGAVQGDVWAEQTYGAMGAWCDDGAGGVTELVAAGSCYGGQSGTASDDASLLSTSEHVTRVTVSGADVTGVDFGFSFDVVVNALAGDAQDDDPANNRSVQGSLRQFVQNANAISGQNVMRLVPVEVTNDSGGGGAWWELSVTTSLPSMTDDSTTVDGTAYQFSDGVSLRNTNPGVLGVGGAVGVDNLALSQVNRPELEVVDGSGLTVGLDVQADDVTVQRLAIYGFGTLETNGDIVIGGTQNGAVIEDNVIGTTAGSFTDPGVGNRSGGIGVYSDGADNVFIRNNVIGFTENPAIRFINNSLLTIEGNEVRGVLGPSSNAEGVDFWQCPGSFIRGNLFIGNYSPALDIFQTSGGGITIENNTITQNGIGAGAGEQTAGIRISTDGSTVRRNVIFDNYGPGVMIRNGFTGNRITENSIYDNGTILNLVPAGPTNQIGIDLLSSTDDPNEGTSPFVTSNDAGDGDTGGNDLLNFPVLTRANSQGGITTIEGSISSATSTTYILEFFSNVTADPSGYGEGETYLGADTVVTDGTGNASFTTQLPVAVPIGYAIAATATDPGNNTSELSLTVPVNDPPTVASAIPDTVIVRNSPPVDNYRDLNDVFDDLEDSGALAFSVQSNSNPALVTVAIDADSALDLSFAPGQTGQATIVIRATDSGALFVEDTFVVTVAGPTISSTANQTFTVADPPTGISLITITDDPAAATITAARDIRVRIDSLFNMAWEAAVTTATIGGSAAGKVSTTVSYDSTWQILLIDVTTDFAPGDQITVSGLSYRDFAAASPPDSLELVINNDGIASAFDDKTIEIVAAVFPNILSGQGDQVYNVGDPTQATRKVTVADASSPIIMAINDIRIRIPPGLNMTWDTTDLTVKTTGNAAPKVSTTVSYEDGGKTLVLNVLSDFAAGEFIHFRELGFANFTARSPADRLEMELYNDGNPTGIDDKTITINDGPIIVSAIPDTTVSESAPPVDNYRDLNDVFDDVEDGSALAFTIESNSDTSLVTVVIDADSALDFSFAPAGGGSATIVVRATDQYGLFVEDTLVVTVTDPPSVVSAIPDTTVAEDSAPIDNYRDLNDVFTDAADGSALAFSVQNNSNPGLVSVVIDADSALDLGFTPDLSGNAAIIVRATDSGSLSVEDTFVVTVTPVNDQPTIASTIPDTTVAEDNAPINDYRDLNDVFADLEDGSALSFSIESNSNPALVTVAIGADSALDLSFTPELSGSATIVVRATDSGALFVEDTFVVTVTPVNDQPTIAAAIPDTTVAEDNPPIDNYRDLNNVFTDIEDGSALSFTIQSNSNPGLVSVVIDADSALDLSFTPSANGSATIVVRATDSGALLAEDTFIINVSSVNDAPTIASAIPDTTVNEDNPPIDNYRDLNDVFADIEDGSALSFSIQSNSNPGLVTVAIDADSALDLSFTPELSGSATIVVRATDSGALFVEDTFVVTVTPVNDQPTIAAAIPDTTVAEDSTPINNYRDLNDVFADLEDGSALSFNIQSNSNPALVTVAIGADSALDLSFAPDLSGSATIVVRATDSGALLVEDTFVVTVTPVNDQPTIAAAIPDTTVAEDNPPINNYRDLNDVFADLEDGSALSFNIQSNSNPGLVTVAIDADSALDLSFTPSQSGSATIVVRATDAGALFAEDTFIINVSSVNDAPTIASAIPDTTVAEDNAPIDNYRDLNSAFTDMEDGSALSFSIESNSNPALVTVAIDADSALDLSFTPDLSGNATIVVRATDSGALFVEDTFAVTVTPVNDQPTIAAAIPDTTVAEDNPPIDDYRDLNDVFADLEDGSALSLSVESNSNPGLVTVAIDADSALDLSFTPELSGSATIVVRATDSGALLVEDTFVVTVTPVNDQ